MTPDLPELVERVTALAARRERVLLGLTGAPGAGKSTLAAVLADALALPAVVVPMDGFHLADAALVRLGLRGRKGAPETFDAEGYAALLTRLRQRGDRPVFAPSFERDLEQPLANAITVPPGTRVVVTEGNYLLLPDDPWPRVRALLDEVWFVESDEEVRLERLTRRHVEHGKTSEETAAWVTAVDDPNAVLVAATRDRADLVLRV